MKTKNLKRKQKAHPGGSLEPVCSVIPAGIDPWTTDIVLLQAIAADVRDKSGLSTSLEAIDDVIISLKARGYVRMSPNEKADLPPTRDVNRDSGTDSATGG